MAKVEVEEEEIIHRKRKGVGKRESKTKERKGRKKRSEERKEGRKEDVEKKMKILFFS